MLCHVLVLCTGTHERQKEKNQYGDKVFHVFIRNPKFTLQRLEINPIIKINLAGLTPDLNFVNRCFTKMLFRQHLTFPLLKTKKKGAA